MNRLDHLRLQIKIKSLAVEAGIIHSTARRGKLSKRERQLLSGATAVEIAYENDPRDVEQIKRSILRKKQRQLNVSEIFELDQHRNRVVGFEARHSLLLYAFMRGKEYWMIEPKVGVLWDGSPNEPNWSRIQSMGEKFGVRGADQARLANWCRAGAHWIHHGVEMAEPEPVSPSPPQ
jgi:hypothetical protein